MIAATAIIKDSWKEGFSSLILIYWLISIKIGRFFRFGQNNLHFAQGPGDNAHIFDIKEYLGFIGESCIKEEKVPQISP